MAKLIHQTKITYTMDDASEFNPYMFLHDFPDGLPLELAERVKFAQYDSFNGWEVIGGNPSFSGNNKESWFQWVYMFGGRSNGCWLSLYDYTQMRGK